MTQNKIMYFHAVAETRMKSELAWMNEIKEKCGPEWVDVYLKALSSHWKNHYA